MENKKKEWAVCSLFYYGQDLIPVEILRKLSISGESDERGLILFENQNFPTDKVTL